MIEERQEQLNSFYDETFGERWVQGNENMEPELVDDLVLDRDAVPPADLLDVMLKDRLFAKTWNHKRDEFKSQSEYDQSLAGFAIRRGWSDQGTADLIIAHRRKWCDKEGLQKALRLDYIKRTIATVRDATTRGEAKVWPISASFLNRR